MNAHTASPPIPRRPGHPAEALWRGVRMRRVQIGADPDQPCRNVTLPADWEDDAAAALARLAPGKRAVSLAQAASHWIAPLDRSGRSGESGAGNKLAERLVGLLLQRAAAPNLPVWQGSRSEALAFTVNLAAFAQPGAGFDTDGFTAALTTVTEALRRLGMDGGRPGQVLLGNLDACLAALALDYDTPEARDVAACIMALASATTHPDRAVRHDAGQLPPPQCVVPRLAGRARAAWQRAVAHPPQADVGLFPDSGDIETGLSIPGAADALLGIEACGFAPVFSPLRPDGRLAASTLHRLAARGLSPEAAFAASLAGETVMPTVGTLAVRSMRDAVSPFVDRPSPALAASEVTDRAHAEAADRAPARRELPARHGGFTQKASVGGHRLYVRTGEYADGRLGEISISPVRDGAAQRGLMDAFSQAVSLGLQHGVPLAAYVEAFAYLRFGPCGPVEGDPAVSHASSFLDYTFRTLALAYLGQALPDAPAEQRATAGDLDALLPLELPRVGNGGTGPRIRQRHGLRLVG